MLLAKDTDDDITLVKELRHEVQTLKERCNIFENRCNTLEKTVEDLKSICNTHQKMLEDWQQHIVTLQSFQGTLDTSYGGEQFEVMP